MPSPHRSRRDLAIAAIGALGVVYGDIGTSPLYAMKRVLRLGDTRRTRCRRRCPTCSACCRWSSGRWCSSSASSTSCSSCAPTTRARAASSRSPRSSRQTRTPARPHGSPSRSCSALFGAGLLYGDGIITPGDLGARRGRGPRRSRARRLDAPGRADHVVDPGRAVLGAALRHRAASARVRLGDAGLVRRDRRDRRALDRANARSCSPRVNPLHGVRFFATHGCTASCCSARVPRRHRRRGALRGHGPLRQDADPASRGSPSCSPACSSTTSARARCCSSRAAGTVTNPFYALVDGAAADPDARRSRRWPRSSRRRR